MKIVRIKISNFRGIKDGEVFLSKHAVLVGDNNSGKSTILEAIDLVLGPERLARRPVIDEHDFYAGRYLDADRNPIPLSTEVVLTDLSEDQLVHFRDHLEWWTSAQELIDGSPPEGTDGEGVLPALRLTFIGSYDLDEDDFIGNTYFASPLNESGELDVFRTSDKRQCGFLFLRTLRTGSRALSLERGSLLDVILKLQDKRLRMWEEVLRELRALPVAEKPEIGVTDIFVRVQAAIKKYVPADWANRPHMRVSDLTRENVRRILTVFLGTGAFDDAGSEYAAPFDHQGTGTINTLVLVLLSMIAELKQNVIFAMEEPEIAIPPHTQRRIVTGVRTTSAQAIFTSHSPYVLELFDPDSVIHIHREAGVLHGVPIGYPPTVKPKSYQSEMRRRFCEALLARRVLILEGRAELDGVPAAACRLNELEEAKYASFEALGVAVICAETDSQIAPLGDYFKGLRKIVFGMYDAQPDAMQKAAIMGALDYCYESPERGFERLLASHSSIDALRLFGANLVISGAWPAHLGATPIDAANDHELRETLYKYFKARKGDGAAAEFLNMCGEEDMPAYLREAIVAVKRVCEPDVVDFGVEGGALACEPSSA